MIMPAFISQNPSITLSSDLTISGDVPLSFSVPLDMNGQVLKIDGAATQVQLASGGLEFRGGQLEVNGGSQLTSGVDWSGIIAGGVASVSAGSTLVLGSAALRNILGKWSVS